MDSFELTSPFQLPEICAIVSSYLEFDHKLAFHCVSRYTHKCEPETWTDCHADLAARYGRFEISSFRRVRDATTKEIRFVSRDGSISYGGRVKHRVNLSGLYVMAFHSCHDYDFKGSDPIRFRHDEFEFRFRIHEPAGWPDDIMCTWYPRNRTASITSHKKIQGAPLERLSVVLAEVSASLPKVAGCYKDVYLGHYDGRSVSCEPDDRTAVTFWYGPADDPLYADLIEKERRDIIECVCPCFDFFLDQDAAFFFSRMFD